MRTGYNTLKSISGWSFYSLEKKIIQEIPSYPGRTIGREQETPTLLEGKEPWKTTPEKIYKEFIVSLKYGEE